MNPLMGLFNSIGKGIGNLFSGGSKAPAGTKTIYSQSGAPMSSVRPESLAGFIGPKTAQMAGSAGGNWLSKMFGKDTNVPQMAAGAGINALGQFMAPKVKTPNFNSSPALQQLSNFEYNKLPGNAEEAINRNLDIQFDSELRNLRNVYKNVRPGTDYTTDSAYQRDLANLQRQQTLNRADALAGPQLQYAQADQQRLQALAEADISQIMLETGMSAQEAEQFKQSFSNVGNMMMRDATGQNDWADIMKLFGGGDD